MSRNFYNSTNNTLTPIAGCQGLDGSLSSISENPVQNKVIKAALDAKVNSADLGTASAKDSTNAVTQNSTDLVESGAVYSYIDTMITQAISASY